MSDKPILFSGPMVRALLDGRKTQTRRVIQPEKPTASTGEGSHLVCSGEGFVKQVIGHFRPKYRVGDRLWVKETHTFGAEEHGGEPWPIYAATYGERNDPCYKALKPWRPSLFMARRYSRLTLTVTDVRVQRLQEINLKDARAEGCEVRQMWLFGADQAGRDEIGRDVYRALWDGLNEKRGYGWKTNPWVVALTFTVQRGNIDQVHP